MDAYQLRDTLAGDFEAIFELLSDAFAATDIDDQREAERLTFEPSRCHVIVHGGRIVGSAGAYSRELTIPGSIVPAAHVSMVSVEPTHRRRGLLNRLMSHQLRSVSESIAVLWASEGRIYQRYGYGMATRTASLRINGREVALLPSVPSAVGTLRSAVPAHVRKELSEVYSRVRAERPGLSGRSETWWEHVTSDASSRRNGYTAKRAVLHEDADGNVTGYAIWRAKSEWDDGGGPNGDAQVLELIAVNPEAYTALWRFLLAVDLTRTVTARLASVDEPLFYLVNEARQLGMRVGDGLWLRIVDLPAALADRRYAAPLDVVIDVTDPLLEQNAGRWRLRVAEDGSATCERTGDQADLACHIADLGASYLGGTPLTHLGLAGRVTELRPGALAAASTAFGWHATPTSIEIF